MGEPEQIPSDDNEQPRSLAERLKTQANGHLSEAEEETATDLAQRFAPDLPEAPSDTRAVLRGNRALFAILIGVALAPTVAIGAAMLWHGLIVTPRMTSSAIEAPAEPTVELAAAAHLPAPLTVQRKRDVVLPVIALTAPEMVAAEAGGEVPFAIALDSAEPAPHRSIIAIRGLPVGSAFSAGRPYGETEWTLLPDEIGDLSLKLPEIAGGERDLAIELLTADGTVIARTTARLSVSDARSALITRPDEVERIGDLIEHGQKMVDVGYFPGARAYFQRAAEAGSAEAALALGQTYDPAFIAKMGAHGIEPEPAQAQAWYERARALGADDAAVRRAKLALVQTVAPASSTPASSEPTTSEPASSEPVSSEPAPSEPASADQAPTPASALVAAKGADESADLEWVEISRPANLRDGPSSNAAAVKVAQKGERLRAIGREGNWVQVAYPATKETGWIYSPFVEPVEGVE